MENAKKNLVFHFGVGRHAFFLRKPFVNIKNLQYSKKTNLFLAYTVDCKQKAIMICDKCNFKTKCHEILVAHVAKKHKQCLKCAQTFSSNDDLLSHLQFVHGENVKCNKCEFKAYPRYGSSDTFTNLEF